MGKKDKGMQPKCRNVEMSELLISKTSVINPITLKTKTKLVPEEYREASLVFATVIGKFRADNPRVTSKEWHNFMTSKNPKFNYAKEIIDHSGIKEAYGNGPYPMTCAELIQKYIGDEYQINVYTDDGPPSQSFGVRTAKQINLFFMDMHAWVLKSMTGFLRPNPWEKMGHCL